MIKLRYISDVSQQSFKTVLANVKKWYLACSRALRLLHVFVIRKVMGNECGVSIYHTIKKKLSFDLIILFVVRCLAAPLSSELV